MRYVVTVCQLAEGRGRAGSEPQLGRTVACVHGGWAVLGAAAGAVAGGGLHPAVQRLSVPLPGEVRSRGVPRAPALAGMTAVLLALLAGRYGARPELIAVGWLAVVGVALASVDLAVHRLPDRLVLPAYPVVLGGLSLAAAVAGDPGRLLRSVAAGVLLAGSYLLLALLRPAQLGLGDVKLAGVLGLVLGWAGWSALLLGSFLAFALLAVCGLVLLALRRVTLRTALPFGPFMLGAALLTLLAN